MNESYLLEEKEEEKTLNSLGLLRWRWSLLLDPKPECEAKAAEANPVASLSAAQDPGSWTPKQANTLTSVSVLSDGLDDFDGLYP